VIFKVWQSVNGSCRDPVRDIVLGCAAVDLSVLLFGMPSVCGWFNIMDSARRCRGQIEVSFHSSLSLVLLLNACAIKGCT
jgi:hypothetical protein